MEVSRREARQKSANALSGLAVVVLIFARLAMSPTANFGGAVLAAGIALCALLVARTAASLVFAAVVLALSLAATYGGYPAHRDFTDVHLVRSHLHGPVGLLRRIEDGLRSACRDGFFPSVQSLDDLRIPQRDRPAAVKHVGLRRLFPDRHRARMEFEELRTTGFAGLDPRVVVPAGAILELEITCEAGVFGSQRAESTLEPKYLPSAWR